MHNSDEYPTVAAVKPHERVARQAQSNGKYKIKVFNKGALGSEKETIDQVKIGALELTRVNISPMNAICAKTHGADHALPVPQRRAHAQEPGRPGG